MSEKKYSAGMVNHSFWFLEFKTFVKLLNEGKTKEDIKKMNEEENVFAASTADRGLHIYRNVLRRINELDKDLLSLFQELDVSNQKLMNLISIMAVDQLFFEFVYEVYREKIMIGSNELSDSDYRIFFRNKQSQNEKIAKWTEQTQNRLSKTYKLLLFEAGVTDKEPNTRKILVPVLDPSLEQLLLDTGMKIYIQALTGAE